jgi:AbrB family looped-hinge helix DNA binding protein
MRQHTRSYARIFVCAGTRLTTYGKMGFMATTTVSSKGQIVIPRHLREKHRLTSGVRLQINETDDGLVLSPLKRARPSAGRSGWRALRGSAKGTNALKQHLEEHRREAKR